MVFERQETSSMNSANGRSPQKRKIGITWRGIVGVIVGVLLVLFGVQNLESAQISFLGVQFSVPVWLLVTGTFGLGVLLGGVVKGTARKLRKPRVEPR